MKLIVMVLILSGIAYLEWFAEEEEIQLSGNRVVDEIRLNIDTGTRTISLVSIIERDTVFSCEWSESWLMENAISCNTRGYQCSIAKSECDTNLSRSYQKLLEGQDFDVSYLKLEHQNLNQAVMFSWGMSKQASQSHCSYIKSLVSGSEVNYSQCV